ncbi:MAG TPA: phospholipase D family protein [Xanthomonadales bacterium]|nr:phospholipase D family protein [Xanthomonadales bacterium]
MTRLRRNIAPSLLLLCIALLPGCASLPQNFTREDLVKLDARDTTLAREFSAHANAHPGLSGAYPLGQGMEALAARVALARRAEKSLDVQYYIWHGDDSGRILLKELLDAADRGVRVRLLLDDLGVGAANDDVFRWVDAHPQVSVELFNPIALRDSRKLGLVSDARRLNRRMHNKSMTADNTVTVVGGRNIGNEYFALDELVNFADMDVLAIGPAAAQVVDSFDTYWNSGAAFPVSAFHPKPATAADLAQGRAALNTAVENTAGPYYQAMQATPLGIKLQAAQMEFYWATITALYDSPGKAKVGSGSDAEPELLLQQLGNLIGRAESGLFIVSPYFVPGKAGTEALVDAVRRGVRVQVLTNSLASTDVGAVHAGYKKWRKKLLQGGVELYEMKPGLDPGSEQDQKLSFKGSSAASLHAKLFVIDQQRLFIGSMNLDPRSVELNTEIGLLIDSADMALDVNRKIEAVLSTTSYRVQLLPVDPAQPDGRKELAWTGQHEGEETHYSKEPHTSFWQRLSVGFISLFPIDSQL